MKGGDGERSTEAGHEAAWHGHAAEMLTYHAAWHGATGWVVGRAVSSWGRFWFPGGAFGYVVIPMEARFVFGAEEESNTKSHNPVRRSAYGWRLKTLPVSGILSLILRRANSKTALCQNDSVIYPPCRLGGEYVYAVGYLVFDLCCRFKTPALPGLAWVPLLLSEPRTALTLAPSPINGRGKRPQGWFGLDIPSPACGRGLDSEART
jgi:hypothetical protein